jgi:CBS domain-containing protein
LLGSLEEELNMNCQDIMRRPVQSCRPTDTALQAASIMRDANVGLIPVCDHRASVVGVVTDRDLALRVCAVGADPGRITIDTIMSRELVSCGPHDPLERAAQQMGEHQKSRVLVVDSAGALLGVISLADLAVHEPSLASQSLAEIARREVLDVHGHREARPPVAPAGIVSQ